MRAHLVPSESCRHVMHRNYDWVALLGCDLVVTDPERSLESVLLVHAGNTSLPLRQRHAHAVRQLEPHGPGGRPIQMVVRAPGVLSGPVPLKRRSTTWHDESAE